MQCDPRLSVRSGTLLSPRMISFCQLSVFNFRNFQLINYEKFLLSTEICANTTCRMVLICAQIFFGHLTYDRQIKTLQNVSPTPQRMRDDDPPRRKCCDGKSTSFFLDGGVACFAMWTLPQRSHNAGEQGRKL